jgi:nucleoside-diphosphate-sugar epimerase
VEDSADVDAFISYSLSVQNRRKSRAGYALEHHLDEIFRESGLRYTRQAVTENNAKPDFLFPGLAEYKDETFPVSRLSMLGVKTTNFYYSYSKGMVEQFLDQFEKENPEIAIIRVRPPIIGSPDDLLKEFKAIGKGKPFSRSLFPLNHNGKKPMQLLHQDDLVDILMLMLKKDVRGAYNVASEPLQDMSVFFKKECNHELKPAFHAVHNLILALHKKWPQLGWIQGWKYSSILNTEKVEKEFNWKPKHTTEELMKTSLQSILKSRKQ